MKCLNCNKELRIRSQVKFCSNKCQVNFQYKKYIIQWKNNKKAGIMTKNISRHIKRYFIDKNGEVCMLCGWNKKHKITGKVPLEIDHSDGNSENNAENNLRLICPNCHALTSNFKNLNKGRGRLWRKNKYIKIKN